MIDIINPEPTTALEAFNRWREFRSGQATIAYGKKITVLDMDGPLTKEAIKWHEDRMVKRYGKNWRQDEED